MTKSSIWKLAGTLGAFALVLLVPLDAVPPPYPKNYYSKANPLFDLRGVDVPPQAVQQIPPELTPELKELRKKATVVVEFVISKNGDTEFINVLESSDYRFDDVSIATAKLWKFKPAMKNGQPVNCRVSQRLSYD